MLSENVDARRILTSDNVVGEVSHTMGRRPGFSVHDKSLIGAQSLTDGWQH